MSQLILCVFFMPLSFPLPLLRFFQKAFFSYFPVPHTDTETTMKPGDKESHVLMQEATGPTHVYQKNFQFVLGKTFYLLYRPDCWKGKISLWRTEKGSILAYISYIFVLFCFPFTAHILKVASSKAEKHMKNFAFVADWWIFYFCHFSPKAKSILCTHEIYTVVLVSFVPYSLTDVFLQMQ